MSKYLPIIRGRVKELNRRMQSSFKNIKFLYGNREIVKNLRLIVGSYTERYDRKSKYRRLIPWIMKSHINIGRVTLRRNIDYSIEARVKRFYSLYYKLQRKPKSILEAFIGKEKKTEIIRKKVANLINEFAEATKTEINPMNAIDKVINQYHHRQQRSKKKRLHQVTVEGLKKVLKASLKKEDPYATADPAFAYTIFRFSNRYIENEEIHKELTEKIKLLETQTIENALPGLLNFLEKHQHEIELRISTDLLIALTMRRILTEAIGTRIIFHPRKKIVDYMINNIFPQVKNLSYVVRTKETTTKSKKKMTQGGKKPSYVFSRVVYQQPSNKEWVNEEYRVYSMQQNKPNEVIENIKEALDTEKNKQKQNFEYEIDYADSAALYLLRIFADKAIKQELNSGILKIANNIVKPRPWGYMSMHITSSLLGPTEIQLRTLGMHKWIQKIDKINTYHKLKEEK